MSNCYKFLLGVCVLSALLFCGCAKNNTDEPAESVSSSETMSAASSEPSAPQVSFKGTDLEGNTVSSDVFSQSKLTMINVWATYCGPCLSEIPELGKLAADYDGSCVSCMACEKACPVALSRNEVFRSLECIRCGKCVDACPRKCLHFGYAPIRFL